MTTSLRLGKDPLGGLNPSDDAPAKSPAVGDDPLSGLFGDPASTSAPLAPETPSGAGRHRRDSDTASRSLEFLEDMIDGAELPMRLRPTISVDMDSDLTEMPMRDAYLLGHALRLILDIGREASPSEAVLHVSLKGRLSGRLELSVTDAGDFFPRDMGIVAPTDPQSRELVDFVIRRGGSVFAVRSRATQVSVVVFGRQEELRPPRITDHVR
jgi:hypothetical protein